MNDRSSSTLVTKHSNQSTNHYDSCSICYTRPNTPLVPPLNFAMIASGVYRSGHPNQQNFAFLRKLGLKTILYFAMEDYPPEMQHFVEQEGIQVFHYRTEGNKEPFIEVNPEDITHALVKLLDKRCHPVLIHCLKGKVSDTHSAYDKQQTDLKVNIKHRIGCLVGCLRKIQNWSMTSIFDEYRKFAGTKVLADQEFIEMFDRDQVPYDPAYKPTWLQD
ncbi:hypothetical protein RMATCC62417_11112 [Rhizopus microsporus]|nr:hypothetical protein RMATCC62417_11112 [Rhizopus microsporus]